jgi:hypothetical protein
MGIKTSDFIYAAFDRNGQIPSVEFGNAKFPLITTSLETINKYRGHLQTIAERGNTSIYIVKFEKKEIIEEINPKE